MGYDPAFNQNIIRRRGDSVLIKAHSGAVRGLSWSWDGAHLLSCSDDKSVKIWSLPSRRFQCSFLGHTNWVRTACFGPDSTTVASGSDDTTVRLFDVSTQ